MPPASPPPLPPATASPPPARSPRRGAVVAIGLALLPWAVGAGLQADEERATLFGWGAPLCPSRALVPDVGCPGCGLTRATTLAAHGDWRRATRLHAGWVAVALASCLTLVGMLPVLARGTGLARAGRRIQRGMVGLALGLVVLWLIRLARPDWLGPPPV